MKFTDRYVKLPIDLYEKDKADIIGCNEETKICDTTISVEPFQISHYRKTLDENFAPNGTSIHMKNGDSFYICLSVKEFEDVINNYQK